MSLRVFAHGGGVQSTAALVLSAQGRIDFPIHLFANVGDDSENPETLTYVREVSMPYAAAHGVELYELQRQHATLLRHMTVVPESGRLREPIPIRGMNGAPLSRSCTADWKLGVLHRWQKDHGASVKMRATVGLGISTDEIERAGRGREEAWERRTYPLIELGLSRRDCYRIIADAGLPTPPKSSCWFCPFHRPLVWAEMRRDHPERFEAAADLEDLLNQRRRELGKDPVYLTRFGRPLRQAIHEQPPTLFDVSPDVETCDEGVCFV